MEKYGKLIEQSEVIFFFNTLYIYIYMYMYISTLDIAFDNTYFSTAFFLIPPPLPPKRNSCHFLD